MGNFAQLFESEKYGQVLAQRGYDPDRKTHIVKITIEYKGLLIEARVQCDKNNMLEIFNGLEVKSCDEIFDELFETVKRNEGL